MDDIIRQQWAIYAASHQVRMNLLLHIVLVPLFLAGNIALAAGAIMQSWSIAAAGLAATLVSLAGQGIGHRKESLKPKPFTSAGNALGRLFAEQWITFPRFVLTGGWWRALRHQ